MAPPSITSDGRRANGASSRDATSALFTYYALDSPSDATALGSCVQHPDTVENFTPTSDTLILFVPMHQDVLRLRRIANRRVKYSSHRFCDPRDATALTKAVPTRLLPVAAHPFPFAFQLIVLMAFAYYGLLFQDTIGILSAIHLFRRDDCLVKRLRDEGLQRLKQQRLACFWSLRFAHLGNPGILDSGYGDMDSLWFQQFSVSRYKWGLPSATNFAMTVMNFDVANPAPMLSTVSLRSDHGRALIFFAALILQVAFDVLRHVCNAIESLYMRTKRRAINFRGFSIAVQAVVAEFAEFSPWQPWQMHNLSDEGIGI